MQGRFILAIDQGTTGSAALVFDRDGNVVGSADKEFPQIYPRPGWVEHDPEAIWTTTEGVVRWALTKARVKPHDVAAIGITNQRETAVAWDARTDRPLTNAIVWQDRRTAPRCDELQDKAAGIRRKTGLVVDAYFSATKWEWMLENAPAAKQAKRDGSLRLGTVDSWLVWKLSGGRRHATDVTNASRTLLFNIDKLRWDRALLDEFNVPGEALPDVVDSSGLVCETDEKAFGATVPVAGIAGDQQAALFGQACFKKGMSKNTYGTGSFLLLNTGAERAKSKRLLSTVAWRAKGKVTYALEGSIFTTGASVQWLRDGLGLISEAAQSEDLARSVEDTGDVWFVPALAGLGAPYWDPYARGALLGLTRGTTKAHVTRAVLEATAYRSRDVALAMQEDAGVKPKVLRVDGGGSENAFLMQFQSDVLGVPVERPANVETTAQGAAMLAGLGSGFWKSERELGERWRLDKRFEPTMPRKEREARYARWLQAVERARGWARG